MIRYRFDGVDQEQRDSHTFVALYVERDGMCPLGCDCYFDGVGGISEVVDWNDGDGIVAHDVIDERRAKSIATDLVLGNQVPGVGN